MHRRSLSPRAAGSQGNAAQEARKACLDVMLLAVEQEESASALQAADLLKQVKAYTGYPAQYGLDQRICLLHRNRFAATTCIGVTAPSTQALGASLLRQLLLCHVQVHCFDSSALLLQAGFEADPAIEVIVHHLQTSVATPEEGARMNVPQQEVAPVQHSQQSAARSQTSLLVRLIGQGDLSAACHTLQGMAASGALRCCCRVQSSQYPSLVMQHEEMPCRMIPNGLGRFAVRHAPPAPPDASSCCMPDLPWASLATSSKAQGCLWLAVVY